MFGRDSSVPCRPWEKPWLQFRKRHLTDEMSAKCEARRTALELRPNAGGAILLVGKQIEVKWAELEKTSWQPARAGFTVQK
jgi:hypothetical protein